LPSPPAPPIAATPAIASPSGGRRHQLSGSASMLLDIVRFAAAIGVVVTHSGEPHFNTGWQSRPIFGSLAVPVFFVLSGFVIRYVTRTREDTLSEYFIDRASRIYSVVLPAMALTLLFSLFSYLFDKQHFTQQWSQYFDHPLFRILFNVIFLSQAWGHNTIPFTNIPYWSLGYECIYYVFYGFLFFLRGWKQAVACLVVALVIGPQVIFLLPIWWLGCWMYDAYHWARTKRSYQIAAASILILWTVLSFFFCILGSKRVLSAPMDLIWTIAKLQNPLSLLGIPVRRATMFAVGTGVMSAIILFLVLLAVEPIQIATRTRWAKAVRRIADGTFVIYLIHYPILVFATYAKLLRYDQAARNFLVVTLIVLFLVALAGPLDALKRQMRRWLRAVVPG